MITHVADLLTINVYKMVALCHIAGLKTITFYTKVALQEMMTVLNTHVCGTYRIQDNKGIIWVHTSVYNYELIATVRKNNPEAKIIWNIHDWVAGCNQYIDLADIVVFPSKGYLKHCPDAKVIYRKVPLEWVRHVDVLEDRRVNAIVLHGDINPEIPYRDYRYIQNKHKNKLFIYPANGYYEGYTHLMRKLDYWSLLKEIATYQYGYAGAPNPDVSFDEIVTNKFWEYLAAGTEPMLWNSREMEDIIANREPIYLGSEVGTLEEIISKLTG